MGPRGKVRDAVVGHGRLLARPFAFCRRAFCPLPAGLDCEGMVRCGRNRGAHDARFELHLKIYSHSKEHQPRRAPLVGTSVQIHLSYYIIIGITFSVTLCTSGFRAAGARVTLTSSRPCNQCPDSPYNRYHFFSHSLHERFQGGWVALISSRPLQQYSGTCTTLLYLAAVASTLIASFSRAYTRPPTWGAPPHRQKFAGRATRAHRFRRTRTN